jgi:hypothetical protein
LEEFNPLLSNLLTFYEEIVIKIDKGYRKAARAHKKVQERSRDVGCAGQDRAF